MQPAPEPLFQSRQRVNAIPKGGIPRRRGLRRHGPRSKPSLDDGGELLLGESFDLDDEPMFSRAELSGSGFNALFSELDGALTLDLDEDEEE